MTGHSKNYSASASARWLSCPASVGLVSQYASTTSTFAEEGSCAHKVAEMALKGNLSYKDLQRFIGKPYDGKDSVKVDSEMVRYADEYAEYCRSFSGDMFVEERVSYETYAPQGFGTADCIIIGDKQSHIIDLKYGRGVAVYAEGNTQAQLYALGVLEEYDFIYDFSDDHIFTLHIYQPRIGNISEWSITVGELRKFGEYVITRVKASQAESPEFNPTEKGCMWCAHKPNCKALMEFTEEMISVEFDNLDSIEALPAVETVDFEKILAAKSLIEGWLDSVEKLAIKKLHDGEKVNGFKLVEGRSLRKWAPGAEEKLVGELGEKVYDKKLLSITQLEKLIGKEEFKQYSDLVVKPRGAPTLAREDDKRKAIGFDDCSCEFDVLD